jgi:hypothetical protein
MVYIHVSARPAIPVPNPASKGDDLTLLQRGSDTSVPNPLSNTVRDGQPGLTQSGNRGLTDPYLCAPYLIDGAA